MIRNGQGQETSSSVDLSCGGKEALLLDTLHPDSVQRIAELEAPRPMPEEAPEPEKQAPQIVKQLTVTSPSSEGPAETQSLHFDAQFTPTDDNTLVVSSSKSDPFYIFYIITGGMVPQWTANEKQQSLPFVQ